MALHDSVTVRLTGRQAPYAAGLDFGEFSRATSASSLESDLALPRRSPAIAAQQELRPPGAFTRIAARTEPRPPGITKGHLVGDLGVFDESGDFYASESRLVRIILGKGPGELSLVGGPGALGSCC